MSYILKFMMNGQSQISIHKESYMTEKQDQMASASVASIQTTSSDWFLELLVDVVNGTEIALAMTLNVGGMLVSGEMCSGHKYFEGFAKDLKDGIFGTIPSEASRIEEQFKQLGGIYAKEKRQPQDEHPKPPQYIHLRNARIFHPGGTPIPTNRGVWWRGRLGAIDGFILGSLSIS
jgi:hypothetical protein